MNRLPRVLQNEIWEYVRGDKTFWRRRFNATLDDVSTDYSTVIKDVDLGLFNVRIYARLRQNAYSVTKWRGEKLLWEETLVRSEIGLKAARRLFDNTIDQIYDESNSE
jgi:hypothetical protein